MMKRLLSSFVILGAFALAPSVARADVAPPNACTGEGSACNTAGNMYNQPGVCTKTTCTKGGPDGSTSYDCYLCMASDSGTAGTGGSGGNSGSGGSAGKSSSSSSSGDSGGCSLVASPEGGSAAALMLLAGAAALAVSRRRR